jgi:D-alanine-D-alanine ligase
MKTHVAVLYGGRSTEHEVSCRSAAFVLKNLDRAKFHVHAVGIDKDGVWWPQDTARLLEDVPTTIPIERAGRRLMPPAPGIDPFAATLAGLFGLDGADALKTLRERCVVFPVLHGAFGEDGTMQGLLELAEVAFVGADAMGSAIGMDKVVSKRLVQAAGVPVVPWVDFREPRWRSERRALLDQCMQELGFPMFVKPARLGSSIGVAKVKTRADLERSLDDAFRFDDKVLVERGLEVREIECAALGGYEPRVSVAGEVVPHSEFYSYDAKYVDADGASVVVPAKLEPAQLTRVQELTRRIFVALELYGMSRIDLFLDKRDGSFYFNEVNTIPGFTQVSQYPMLWNASGVPGSALVEALVETALQRQRVKRALVRSR